MKFSVAALALLTTSVSTHTIFTQLHVNGVGQEHLKGVRVPTYDGPIQDVTSNDMICNGELNPLKTPLSTDIINVSYRLGVDRFSQAARNHVVDDEDIIGQSGRHTILGTRAGAFSPEYVSFPGAYKGTDPGVKFQMYWPKPTNYTIPGPRPLVC